jgi:hypothetical protein
MAAQSTHNLTVELSKSDHGGSAWMVRVYRKGFLGKKLVSSDWFLDEQQARRFAEQLTGELGAPSTVQRLRSRPPGWTLHRPSH